MLTKFAEMPIIQLEKASPDLSNALGFNHLTANLKTVDYFEIILSSSTMIVVARKKK